MLVASLAHRRPDRLRLSVGIEPRDIVPYLEDVGWKGERAVSELLARVEASGWPVVPVQMDIDPAGIGERISLEFYSRASIEGDPRWDRLLAHLVDSDRCSPSWPRYLRAWSERAGHVDDQEGPISLRRELDVKIGVTTAGDTFGKAYLAFQPQITLLR
jgi:hypothetical protein